ncbi:MAG: HPr(Ser) kinase/phosphatase [Clostridia bacterium]
MAVSYSIGLDKIIKDGELEVIYSNTPIEEILITNSDINRPGLQLAGFYDYFDSSRIQIIGMVEYTYLNGLSHEERHKSLETFLSKDLTVLIITRNLDVSEDFLELAKKYNVPILRTKEITSSFMSNLITYLSTALGERITRHGVLVEVYGEGILLLGESGVGKSETAMELLKRGHRLIADDAVEIKKVSNRTLLGKAPEIIRHFIELRGIGIVDVRRIFGMGAVKESEKINLVIELENWDEEKQYDRLGLDDKYTEILGLKIPLLNIPVKPGRNLAIIIEVAAMNNRQRRLGYNAAEALNDRLISQEHN